MQTITADQFKKKYGKAAVDTFDTPTQDDNTGLFDAIKKDITTRGQENLNIMSKNPDGSLKDNSMSDNVQQGFQVAANTAGGIGDVAGEALKRIPGVGPALGAVGGAIKTGFNAVTDKLSNTKFFKEAAAGLKPNSPVEKGLSIASSGGEIAGNILGADAGAGTLNKVKDVAAAVPSKVSGMVDSIPKPNLTGTGANIKNAIQDVAGTVQNRIDHNIATALELTPGDLKNIEASTGNQVGKWLSDNNLIGANKATTQGAIDAFKTKNYNEVRSEIDKVNQVYTPDQIPRYTDALKAIQSQIQNTVGLEKDSALITKLLNKQEITLKDIQKAKELLDDHFSLYKVTGDVAGGVAKEGLANVRTDLKNFIEAQVKKHTGADIRQLNNNVATARSLSDAITARSSRGITRAMLSQRDVMMGLGLTYFGSPLVGLAYVLIKKIATSPTMRLRIARWLDAKSDAYRASVSKDLQKGEVPDELKKIVGNEIQ